MSIELSVIAPHVPSICHKDQVPEFQQEMVAGLKVVSEEIAEVNPDVIVLISCHWPSTFNHYVDCTPVHKGFLTAMEIPEVIKDVPYHYPGDEALGQQLVQAGQAAGIPVIELNDPLYVWDYGTLVPLRHLVPNENIPVINMCVTLTASIEETYKWGQAIAEVLRASDKKCVFVASGAFSHNLVRGRHNKPSIAEHAMDKRFLELLMNKEYQAAYDMLPQYASAAKVESGGRHLAMLLGILDQECQAAYYGDGQSSGSWNPVITFSKKNVSSTEQVAEEVFA